MNSDELASAQMLAIVFRVLSVVCTVGIVALTYWLVG